MKVDRAQFLSLAAAIAACNTPPLAGPAAPPPPPPSVEPTPPAPPPAPLRNAETPDPRWGDMCNGLEPPGPSCESFEDSLVICAGLSRAVHRERGSALMECIEQQSGTENMCFNLHEACIEPALRAAAAHGEAATTCGELVQRCGFDANLDLEMCQGAFHLVVASKRDRLTRCLADRCTNWVCLESVGFPPLD